MPSGSWISNASGNWITTTTSTWQNGAVANGNDSTATFNINITAIRTITVAQNLTIASLYFNDATTPSHYWVLTRSASNLLTLQSVLGDGIPTITTDYYTHILNGVLAGTNGFRKLGNNSLRITTTANPVSGQLYIDAGAVQMGEHGSGIINTLPNITQFNLGGSAWVGLWYLGQGNFTETRTITGTNSNSGVYSGTNGMLTLNTSSARSYTGNFICYTDESLTPNAGIDFLTNFPIASSNLIVENWATSNTTRQSTLRFSHNYPVIYDGIVYLSSPVTNTGGLCLLEVNTNSPTEFSGLIRRSSQQATSVYTINLSGTGTDCSVSGRIRNNSSGTTSDGVLALSKSGSGIWVLSGDNDYTGNTSLTAGTLRIQSNTALGAVAGGAMTLSGGTLRLEGGRALDKGTAALTLGGSQIVIDANTGENSLKCGPVGITGTNAVINVGTGSSFFLNNSGIISSAGEGIVKDGDGDLILPTAANTFGGFGVNGGNLTIGSIANSGSPASWGSGTSPVKIPKNLKINGTGGTTNRPVMFVGSTPSIESVGAGTVTFSASSQGGGNRTITLKGDNTGDNTFSGPLKESGAYRVMGMNIARGYHGSVKLANGKVLTVGGTNNTSAFSSCELYDPSIESWTLTGTMLSVRFNCTDNLCLLNNGKVLVAGGMTTGSNTSVITGCELYDPDLGTWSAASAITTARTYISLIKLNDGRVLSTGGMGSAGTSLTTCQIYTPNATTGTWSTNTPSMTTARWSHTSTLFPDGRVLIAGGYSSTGPVSLNSFQIFNPAGNSGVGSWSAQGTFTNVRHSHIAALISGGTKVLIAGGWNQATAAALSSCEIYNIATETWSAAAPMNVPRHKPTHQILSDGRVLVAGGYSSSLGAPVNSIEIYDPIADSWTLVEDMLSSVSYINTSAILNDGRVLVIGGYITGSTVTNICSTYNPSQTLALTKSGTGKWILGGDTLSYSGTTSIEEGTLDLGGTLRVLSGGVTMSGGTLVNGLNKHVDGNITVTSGTNLITAGILGTSTLNVTGGTVTLDYPVNNTYTGGTTVSAGATLKAVTSADPAVTGGKVLGEGTVTVSGTLKTGSSSTQRGQLRYGGTLTFNGGSKIYLGGA